MNQGVVEGLNDELQLRSVHSGADNSAAIKQSQGRIQLEKKTALADAQH